MFSRQMGGGRYLESEQKWKKENVGELPTLHLFSSCSQIRAAFLSVLTGLAVETIQVEYICASLQVDMQPLCR